jgi:Ca2+-binding RTX toxin-like protein
MNWFSRVFTLGVWRRARNSAGAEAIHDGTGSDVVNGGGNDLLYGGSGRDVFAFSSGWARDTVADYRDNYDKLDFSSSGAANFAQLTVAQVGLDAVVSFGGNKVVLLGINAATINQADFIFARSPS